jgi:hypothetical protein
VLRGRGYYGIGRDALKGLKLGDAGCKLGNREIGAIVVRKCDAVSFIKDKSLFAEADPRDCFWSSLSNLRIF